MKDSYSDRFVSIAKDYATLWNEIFLEAGFDYRELQKSVFTCALDTFPDLKKKRILDLGVGDGETIKEFQEYGCEFLSGLDLNPIMLEASHRRFGESVKLIHGDIRELGQFIEPGCYDLIISGATFHNIARNDRANVWDELITLKPSCIISGDKIADTDALLHARYLNIEMEAIIKVYKDRHNLVKESDEWIEHYIVDEREKLYLEEIDTALSKFYNTSLVFEMGMYKTLKCNLF